tara:strand:- start:906 stop:1355 length:450 start_codon:yes stop_codon:yes gene_type:complete
MTNPPFVNNLDVSVSYSETASADADIVTSSLCSHLSVYNYKSWLDSQAGFYIVEFSEQIYCKIPCIILATADWFLRPATVLEMEFLRYNECPKLVFDYIGEFTARQNEHCITNWILGDFDMFSQITERSLLSFAQDAYPAILGSKLVTK